MFHIKLLRKLKKSVSVDKWERALAKFAHTYNMEDGWEIERFGYKRCKLNLKLRLLKNRAPIAREIFRTLSGLWWVGGVKCFCTNVGLPSHSMLYLGPYTDPERGETIKYDVK